MTITPSVLYEAIPPWLMQATTTLTDLIRGIEHTSEGRAFAIRSLDGRTMTTVNGVFKEFGESLGFPDYYGSNSAAIEECLNDLSWLPAPGYILVITNSSALLGGEPEPEMAWLMTLLERVCEEWSRPVSLGEEWDRPEVPFHVVFQLESNENNAVPRQISLLPSLTPDV
jgi:RNAse (barnase) inhibitor barstar